MPPPLPEDSLAASGYFGCTELTAADIMMQTYLSLAAQFVPDAIAAFPRLTDFLSRMEARPAYRRAAEVTEAT